MLTPFTPRTWLVSLTLVVLLVAGLALSTLRPAPPPPTPELPATPATPEPATTTTPTVETIGRSVEGREIGVWRFGSADAPTHLLFVGGMHGGYEWNSVLLAYEFIDHFTENPEALPDGVAVSIIPDLNPDGTSLVTGVEGRFSLADVPEPRTRVASARFNENGVDLNRNFDCRWAPESTWRGNVVSAGTGPFSEPEAVALRDYVLEAMPDATVFWHSQASNVYASECEDGVLPATLTLMNAYASAAGYGAVESFDAYPITGDAEGWLASIGIPAITVELESFSSIEWERNLAGTNALFETYAK